MSIHSKRRHRLVRYKRGWRMRLFPRYSTLWQGGFYKKVGRYGDEDTYRFVSASTFNTKHTFKRDGLRFYTRSRIGKALGLKAYKVGQ